MLKTRKICSIIILVFMCSFCQGKKYPKWLGDAKEALATRIMFINLLNMTASLCKDSMYKLRMVEKIQENYKNSLAYELGLLAAGIMDKFKHMITIYRHFSKMDTFKKESSPVYEILNGYSVMQSDYNEIIIEREMYLQIVAKEIERQIEEDRIIADYHAKNPHIPLAAIKDARDRGIKLPGMKTHPKPGGRRTMDPMNITDTKPGARNQIQVSKRKGKNWAKNDTNTEEAEYKKKLRYIMWAEIWKGFNPEIEGVHIPDPVAKVGLANASNFLAKELKGNV